MAFHYQLTPALAKELRSLPGMHAGAWRLWSYLATLDPFGGSYQELPELVDILSECNMSKPTFYRAMALFIEHNLFDLQPGKQYFRNLRGSKIVSHMRQENHTRDGENHTRDGENHTREKQSPKTPSNKDRQCTNNRSNKDLKEQNNGASTKRLDKEGIGTSDQDSADLRALLVLVEESGIDPNKTIRKTIATLISQQGAAAAAEAVENNLSAALEQQRLGNIRTTIEAVFVAGLKKSLKGQGFTANHAKKEARHKREDRKTQPFNEVEMQIDGYLINNRRDLALHKLQSLWSEGLHDALEAVCTLRTDWKFNVTAEGVRDAAD